MSAEKRPPGALESPATSAIPGMEIAETRKALGILRAREEAQTEARPLFLSSPLTERYTVSQFALEFVMGHHNKRHGKSSSTARRRGRARAGSESSEAEP